MDNRTFEYSRIIARIMNVLSGDHFGGSFLSVFISIDILGLNILETAVSWQRVHKTQIH